MKNLIKQQAACLLMAGVAALSQNVLAANAWDNRSTVRPGITTTPIATPTSLHRLSPAANGAVPATIGRAAHAPAATAELTEVISENFDKCTSGSEDAPDMSTNILDSDGLIMFEYVQTYGWAGIALYQAGGCIYMADGNSGLLATPVLDLSASEGNFTIQVSFRAESASTTFYVGWGSNSTVAGYRRMTATTEWQTATIEAQGGASQMMVQFYGYAPVFIDNIVITQNDGTTVEPTIAAPQAMAATDITATSFTANWQPVQNATAYLLDVFYYEDNVPQYVLQDESTSLTSYAVSDLDADRLYYYTVQATDGSITSVESSMVVVKAASESIGTPHVTEPTDVTAEGFRANWDAVDGAVYYSVSTLSYYTISTDREVAIEDEHFDGITEGTATSPVYNDTQTLLNDYTQYPNWEGITTVNAEGMLGMRNYMAVMGQYSMLYTPVYQIVAGTYGSISITLTTQTVGGSPSTILGVGLVDAFTGDLLGSGWNYVEIGTSEKVTNTLTFPGCEAYYFVFAFEDPNDPYGTSTTVFFDDIAITQELSAGSVFARLYADDIAYNNTLYVPTPGKRDTETFSYSVMAVTNGSESMITSDYSDEMAVPNAPGAVDAIEGTQLTRIYGTHHAIEVSTQAAAGISVYDISGRLVATRNVDAGNHSLSVAPGLYIVKAGDATAKVVVK